jgi:hypothetical protein
MVLQPSMMKTLEEIDFVNWYKALSLSHQSQNRFTDIDPYEAREMIAEFGFPSTIYIPIAKFFIVADMEDDLVDAGLSISLKNGEVELVLNLINETNHRFSGSFTHILRKLGCEEHIPKPTFSSYAELYAILKEVIGVYKKINHYLTTVACKKSSQFSYVKG